MKHLHKLLAVVIIAVLFMTVFSAALTPATVAASASPTTAVWEDNGNGHGKDKPICITPDFCIIRGEVAWNS